MYFIIMITIFALKLFFAKNFIKKIYVVRVIDFFFKKAYIIGISKIGRAFLFAF